MAASIRDSTDPQTPRAQKSKRSGASMDATGFDFAASAGCRLQSSESPCSGLSLRP